MELYALFLRVMYFLYTGGKLDFGSSVYDVNFSAKSECSSRCIHCYVTAADNCNLVAAVDRGVIVGTEALHQVVSGKELVSGEYAVCLLAGDAHELRQASAGADEYGIVTFLGKELINCDGLADDYVGLDLNAELLNGLDLVRYNSVLRKTELGDTVNKYAAGLMQCFENLNFVAHLCQVACAGKACRAGTDNGNFFALLLCLDFGNEIMLAGVVCYETLQFTNGNGLKLDAHDTFALTLGLLRAYTAADCRKCGRLADDIISLVDIASLYLLDESGDVDINRTCAYAGGFFAVKASGSLFSGFFFIISQTNLQEISGTCIGILLTYRYSILFCYSHYLSPPHSLPLDLPL